MRGALVFGPVFGLCVAFVFGLGGKPQAAGEEWLDNCLKHFGTRFCLVFNGSTPWNYVRFLDYAAERILLRKVGGGYIFIHRMLLEYFAARYVDPSAKESDAAKPTETK